MDLTAYVPAVRQHGLLTWTQALGAGLDPRDVRRLVAAGAWLKVRRGVYTDRESYEALDPWRAAPLLRVRAAALVLATDGVFSHDSAALVLGLGVPDGRTALVHRTRARVCGTRLKAGIKHHGAPYHPGQVTVVDGLSVLDGPRTALDTAREHGFGPGLAAADAALRLGSSPAALRLAARAMRNWPGKSVVDRVVDLADAGSESWLESLGRALVLDLGIGRPETQVGLSDGHRTVFCDFGVGRHMFEVDGRVKYAAGGPDHRGPDEVLWEEKRRQDFIAGFGLGVSRITQEDCGSGRPAALRRLAREFAATEARWGRDVSDLAPYRVDRRPLRSGNM
ncbi:type IV toxin-antitoxin system AbiEi family antitoxin domain-containing protein [Nocardioides perillae]|uniref:AbiEi antitoxin N-terminal domain-containing protein n=1 Tax=Nocardioides perillae TaxID=1119534 RepID=A0A7Y9RU00_9ACTN|nr:hypothetical protein [Nocardioides perillae]